MRDRLRRESEEGEGMAEKAGGTEEKREKTQEKKKVWMLQKHFSTLQIASPSMMQDICNT